jgi:hypothetical protein
VDITTICQNKKYKMKLFEFLKLLDNEKYPFKIDYLVWIGYIRVTVNTFSKTEIYDFDENGIVDYTELTETISTEDQKTINSKILDLIDRPTRTWIEASNDLNIRFIHPYIFKGVDNNEYQATGLLPDFGFGKGVLITSRKDDDEVSKMAEITNEYFMTGLNPYHYDKYDRLSIIETLSDWGWIGNGEKPNWIIKIE